ESRWLRNLIGLLYRQSERYRHIALSNTVLARDVHAEHAEIYDAALVRDTERAAKAIARHIHLTFDAIRIIMTQSDAVTGR
ncbi:MAG: FCD domain-containing protein, partial [Bacillota bacterium]